MRIFSEFIVVWEDGAMPDPNTFGPSIWASQDFDSDGDFYAEGIAGRWSHLELARRGADVAPTTLTVLTYYANHRPYEPGLLEIDDLQRYLAYRDQGRYQATQAITAIHSPAVTSLAFETSRLEDYRELIETVYGFLQHSHGTLVYPHELDSDEFRDRFLTEAA